MAERVAVMVRVHGPDPKARKMRHHAFFSADSGDTALSASGVLLCLSNHSAVVVTCASIVEPFLSSRANEALQGHHSVQLVPGTELQVFIDVNMHSSHEREAKPVWFPAELLKLVDVFRASEALKALFDVQGSSEGWEIGWTLAHDKDNQLGAELVAECKLKEAVHVVQSSNNREMVLDGLVETNASMAAASTRIAVLGLKTTCDVPNEVVFSSPCKRGETIRTVGSPFGALSPLHFFNSVSVGVVSNAWPSSASVILMADIRCLPGMEGAPAFDNGGSFAGILLRPIRQRSSGAEVQLILPAEVLVSALRHEGFEVLCSRSPDISKEEPSNENIQQAVSSVVLVTSNDGSWASGILLNKTGLILTNAHLLEPWRFRKSKTDISTVSSSVQGGAEVLETFSCSTKTNGKPQRHINFTQVLRVCLQQQARHRSWLNAKVIFVSQGPLDVALLQLSSVPPDIQPITVEPTKPVPGSAAYVIGHALFGPRAELGPSVTGGVVSRVIEAGETVRPLKKNDPLMLQTTAAVHPGASGGAVVNAQGRLIGLVTSNTKHNRDTVIPHLNFSIPCAALEPIFVFANSGTPDRQLLVELEKENRLFSAVWAAVPPTAPSPRLPWQRQKDGVAKGSQFAKFIAESQLQNARDKIFIRSSL